MHNEAAGIAIFLNQLQTELKTLSQNYEIIVVDDGSDDATPTILQTFVQDKAIKLIQLSRNFGKEAALTAGLNLTSGEATILIDADLQHPINMLTPFLQHWAAGYDMVYGIRANRNDESKLKRWITHNFYSTMQMISRVNIIPNAGDFRLLDQKVVMALNQCEERNRFMKGLYAWVGFKSIGLPFAVIERVNGRSSWNYTRLTELAITGITSFSNIPLRIWSFVGLSIALCSLVTAVWILIKTLIFGIDVPGYASTMIAIFFFCGVQLLSVGILGEYIARIFTEVKRRPQYIIERKLGF